MSEQEQLAEVKRLFFKNWSLLADLLEEDLNTVIDEMHIRQFKAGEIIINQGEAGNSFFVILAGSASVSVRREDDWEFTVATLRQGTTFGEMSILAGAPRNATVRALEASIMVEIDRKGFDYLTHKSSVFKNAMDSLYLSRGLATHLKLTSIFAILGSEVIEKLIAEAKLRIYQADELICRQGDPVHAFLLLKSGTLEVAHSDSSETIVAGQSGPRYYGHTGLLEAKPWDVSLKAKTRVEMVELPRERMIGLMEAHSDLKAQFAAL
ncbi:MAG: cyclic nucleotide-binding domain-containing protein [Acidobacteriota bacterium]